MFTAASHLQRLLRNGQSYLVHCIANDGNVAILYRGFFGRRTIPAVSEPLVHRSAYQSVDGSRPKRKGCAHSRQAEDTAGMPGPWSRKFWNGNQFRHWFYNLPRM